MPQENHTQFNGTNGTASELVGYEDITEGCLPSGATPGTELFIKKRNPSASVRENGDSGAAIAGLALGVGGLAATIFVPEGAACLPPLLADVIGPAIGITWSFVAPEPLPDEPCATDIGVFQNSVNEQQRINRGDTEGLTLPEIPRIVPTQLADSINSSNINEYFNQQRGQLRVTARKAVGQLKVTYIADGYDTHGYVGDVFPNKTVPGSDYKIVTYFIPRQ